MLVWRDSTAGRTLALQTSNPDSIMAIAYGPQSLPSKSDP